MINGAYYKVPHKRTNLCTKTSKMAKLFYVKNRTGMFIWYFTFMILRMGRSLASKSKDCTA